MSQSDTHRGIIAWFARNHVSANLLMIIIALTGLISALNIRTQMLPDMEAERISVDISFPGASPGEVESGIVSRVEESLRDIEGISELRSIARRGFGSVRLDLIDGYEIGAVLDEVKLAVDRISSMPEEAEKPRIYKRQFSRSVLNVQVYGDLGEKSMKLFAESIRDEILSLPSVSKAEVAGSRAYEISVELKEAKLRQYGLSLKQVAEAVRNSSLDLPAGSIRSDSGDILLRTQGQAYHKQQFENIVLITRADGTRLTLADIANVSDGFVEQAFYSLFNGQPSMGVRVYAISDQNQLTISKEVQDFVKERAATLPPNVHLESWLDGSEFLNTSRNMMLSNMISGVVLVLVVLGIFLRLQLAFWVMLGMPIAFLGAFALLPLVGGSINMISLFGFILVLGIVVDDAIIIGESVQSSIEVDGHTIDNVIRGAQRVATPATFGVLTTIVTFIPLLFVPGTFGAMPAAIGWVVILCLVFSIIESKLILPAHLASMKRLPTHKRSSNSPVRRFQSWFALGLKKVITQNYTPLLMRSIENRYVTVSLFAGMLILAVGFISGPYMRTVAFPNMTSNYLHANVELIEGSSPAQAVKIVDRLTETLVSLNDSKPESEKFIRNMSSFTNSRQGTIMVELVSLEGSDLNPSHIAREWRKNTGDIAGTKTMEISGSQKSHGNRSDISIRLISQNNEELKKAAEMLEIHMKKYAGVYDIENEDKGNIPEINLSIKPSAEALGLSLNDLARQVRGAFYGVEVQRIQRGREEVKVMVRYPREERESIGNLENMYVRTPQGDEVPFTSVANIEMRMSPSRISHIWGNRSVVVSANVEKTVTEPSEVVQDITRGEFSRELKAQFPSVRIELGGASLEEAEFLTRTTYTAALALFAIYALMAIPLKSYAQPLIIMVVIPFGMIGALIGHIVVGIDFSALSMLGIVALAGVVVNDSILMVDFVNKSVAQGMPITEAAVKAGTERFRAIMLTSLTTFFGLLPILLETSLSAQLVTPMAVSLGFGILFATVITLILIPCLYVILNDITQRKPSSSAVLVGD